MASSKSKVIAWGNAHVQGGSILHDENVEDLDLNLHRRFDKLPTAFKISKHEDANPVELSLVIPSFNEDVIRSVLQDAFTVDPQVKGDRVANIKPELAWSHMAAFRRRGLVLYFTGKLPLIWDVA